MRSTGSVRGATPGTKTQNYSPSVPLSVYRDLARELQAHQVKIDTLSVQNQQLVQENQLLRQEISKAVESILHLQKMVNQETKVSYYQVPQPFEDFRPTTQPTTRPTTRPTTQKNLTEIPRKGVSRPSTPVVISEMEVEDPNPEPVYIEEQDASYYLDDDEPEPSQINGWMFVVAILLIIVMGFGAGYLIVRPMLQQHSR